MFTLIFCLIILPLTASTPVTPTERQQISILFLSSSDLDLPDMAALIEEAETQIIENQDAPVHFTLEYLDPALVGPYPSQQRRTLSVLQEKHPGQTFDLVITIGEQVAFFEQLRTRLSPEAALLFLAVRAKDDPSVPKFATHTTGIVRTLNYLPTLQLALQQNPGTRHVIIVSGSSDFENLELKVAREQFRSYEQGIQFKYWTDLKIVELNSRLRTVEPDSIVLFLDYLADPSGEQYTPARVLRTISGLANRPIYGTFSSFVGNGVVGGSVADLREVGRILGRTGVRILKGERPEDIPVETGDFQRYVFDWRQLHRWGIADDQLPPGSSVLYWQYSPWELYGWKFLGLFAVVVVEALLIIALLRSRATRKRGEEALQRKEEELREAQALTHLGSWRWDPQTDAVTWSDEICKIMGFDRKLLSLPFKQFSPFLTPESRRRMMQCADNVLQSEETCEFELECIRGDGSRVWLSVHAEAAHNAEAHLVQVCGTMQDITRRKQAEEELKRSEEKFSKAFRLGPLAVTLTNTKSQTYLDVNETFERLTGYSREEVIGRSVSEVGLWVDPTLRTNHIKQLLTQGCLHDFEFEFRTKEGQVRSARASAELIEIAGEPCVLGVAADITDHKRAQEALTESEKRFRLMADSAPVLMWVANPDKLCTDFNKEWLTFTGRTIPEELGEGWTDNVHPDDLATCLDTYSRAFDARQTFMMEYRLRRHDGQYRWMLDSGVPRFLENGNFEGYIGCCIDITDEKEARAERAELGGRLIRAQEEERARIARELHDDVNQRLALLANGLKQLQQGSPRQDKSLHHKLQELWQLTSETATDIQHLSHQLHPAKIRYLGLAASARDLCSEFSKQHKIMTECIVRNLPRDLDESISLSLFRVIQESLHNVAKHSQARHAKVEITGQSALVRLQISDDGVGFNPDATGSNGLGLVSMRERLRLVGGELSIWSRPSLGTEVKATVPIVAKAVCIA